MFKKIALVSLLSLLYATQVACTSQSTLMAQDGSFRSQSVTDGVHRDMFKALSRENHQVTVLDIQLAAEKAKQGQPSEVQAAIDVAAARAIQAVTEFAVKRDKMVEWDRDHERANAYKYVTVDAKLFSSQGILNYLGSQLSEGSKKVFDAWDAATQPTK